MSHLGDVVDEVYAQAAVMLGSMDVLDWWIRVDGDPMGGPGVILEVVVTRDHRVRAPFRVRSAGRQYTKWLVRERLLKLRQVLTR